MSPPVPAWGSPYDYADHRRTQCAYLDNELDLAGRAEVEQALSQDAQLKTKFENWTAQTLNLRGAFDRELDEPLPEALLQLTHKPAAAPPRPREKTPSWIERVTR
jgi:anti-sigma factor RsiW